MSLGAALRSRGACDDAATWADAYTDPATAWDACHRADWMLWILGKIAGPAESDSRKALVLCACDCAETSLRFIVDEYDNAVATACIQTARAWAHGEAEIGDIRSAADASYASYATARSAAAADASYASYATARSADAAYAADASYAADAAAYAAARYAADASYAADAAADRTKALDDMADIVRAHYPSPPVLP